MEIKIYENTDAMYSDIANHIISVIRELPSCVLGLATGTTPERLYEKMVKSYQLGDFDAKDVTTFNLDEYVGLSKVNPMSYHTYMHHQLFKHVKFKQSYIPQGLGDLTKQVKQYDKLLETYPIDLQLLGIGENGHIAFNEPDTSFGLKTHIAKLTEKTKSDNARFFKTIEEVPTHAITMGIASIMEAKAIILVATGTHKAEAIYQMIYGNITEKVPASILRKHPNIKVYIDQKAASKIKGEIRFE